MIIRQRKKSYFRKLYWYIPIAILLACISYVLCLNWGFNTSEAPLWFWALDKFITVSTLLGAAYGAQYVFNKNARVRENRERRLKVLHDAMNSLHGIELIIKGFYDFDIPIEKIISPAKKEIRNMLSSMELHKIMLKKELKALEDAISEAVKSRAMMASRPSSYGVTDTRPLLLYFEKVLEPSIDKLKARVVSKYKDIEENH